MTIRSITPVDEAISFGEEEIIVSKTDLKGKLVYANDVFCRVAEMTTRDVIGKPHNIIRHPDMPGAIFKLLWDKIQAGMEIFAFVKNMSKTGKYYWVLAHVTPSYDEKGQINGYHSNRRFPPAGSIEKISALYKKLTSEEKKHANSKEGQEASSALLYDFLDEQGQTYDEYVWSFRG